jgi:hypothetical protein
MYHNYAKDEAKRAKARKFLLALIIVSISFLFVTLLAFLLGSVMLS